MISPKSFYNHLIKENINFFTGVPDSLLKDLCFYINDNGKDKHVIAANEGNAVALSIGYHLSTAKTPMIYLQNSGLGNIINPLLSLADDDVYGIPMLLVIGWRGQPKIKDEPQHKKQGRVMLEMLKSMKIPYKIIYKKDNQDVIRKKVSSMIKNIHKKNAPCAIVVEKGVFNSYLIKSSYNKRFKLNREKAMHIVLENIHKDSVIVATTGYTSRELFEFRKSNKGQFNTDFLTVGGMGHANQIAAGISMNSNKTVYCFDGDGSILMHMGTLAINPSLKLKNFKHIIFNNGSHESVGGQPTVGYRANFNKIAKNCGYKIAIVAKTDKEIRSSIKKITNLKGTCLLEILVSNGTRNNLSRPDTTPKQNKEALISYLKK